MGAVKAARAPVARCRRQVRRQPSAPARTHSNCAGNDAPKLPGQTAPFTAASRTLGPSRPTSVRTLARPSSSARVGYSTPDDLFLTGGLLRRPHVDGDASFITHQAGGPLQHTHRGRQIVAGGPTGEVDILREPVARVVAMAQTGAALERPPGLPRPCPGQPGQHAQNDIVLVGLVETKALSPGGLGSRREYPAPSVTAFRSASASPTPSASIRNPSRLAAAELPIRTTYSRRRASSSLCHDVRRAAVTMPIPPTCRGRSIASTVVFSRSVTTKGRWSTQAFISPKNRGSRSDTIRNVKPSARLSGLAAQYTVRCGVGEARSEGSDRDTRRQAANDGGQRQPVREMAREEGSSGSFARRSPITTLLASLMSQAMPGRSKPVMSARNCRSSSFLAKFSSNAARVTW